MLYFVCFVFFFASSFYRRLSYVGAVFFKIYF